MSTATTPDEQPIQEGDTVQISVTGEIKDIFDAGYFVYIPHARKSVFIRSEQLLSLVEKRRTRKPKSKPEKHFDDAISTLFGRLEYDVAKDREIIRQFLGEFAEHVLWHTIPAAGSTIKKYKGLSIEEIAKVLPDMEVEP
jgi:hypothetical protein